MKVSDYIVEYLIDKGITDVFGYPGGMVTHLMESFSKYSDRIKAHVTYHEQGASFAACGYAQASERVGVAYATSGPGATNLITGICNAYFDSVPVLFITGQVNTFEAKGDYKVRQRGFQETDIISMVASVTKYSAKVDDAEKIKWYLDQAFDAALSGRKGPVLLDIPMNIFRADINSDTVGKTESKCIVELHEYPEIVDAIKKASKPVLLIGNGVKLSGAVKELRKFVVKNSIPVVTTMLAVDAVEERNFGFIGAYGSRSANFIVAKSDLVISLGTRLDVRQVGAKRENFAPDSTIIRIDIDTGELEYKVHENEMQICADVKIVLKYLNSIILDLDLDEWITICNNIRQKLFTIDDRIPNMFVKKLGMHMQDNALITTDVGQNQVWIAQSLQTKNTQRIFFSGGHGAMGYSLPAAIGCAIATRQVVYCFNGDGGIQMNIQELQVIAREHLPVKIILFNNYSLGMIRHFQEMYFNNNFYQTVPQGGYTVPDFEAVAKAYKIPYLSVEKIEDIHEDIYSVYGPQFIEVKINEPTYVFPKLEFGKPNQDQEPLLDRKLYDELMSM